MLDLSRLSAEQRQAVIAPNGPLLILAGPGSGKTTVLAARIAYLVIARGVRPERVLAVAFARRAARELQGRLVGVLSARDLDAAVLAGKLEETAGSLARAAVLVLTPELTLAEAALRLAQAGVTRAPVVDSIENGLLVGFLSPSDLIQARLVAHEEEAGPSIADLG